MEKQRAKKLAKQGKVIEPTRITLKDPSEANNIYAKDPNQLDLIKSINSAELLEIADKFDQYPGEEVDLEQFVKIMHGELADTPVARREDFVEQLVDLFNRSNLTNSETIKFSNLTSYLIQHEIRSYTMNTTKTDMLYEEVKYLKDDQKNHKNEIEKIYYFSNQKIDKIVLFETNMREIKIYDAVKMTHEVESKIKCPEKINAIEFLPDRNVIAISLSDHTIRFYELKTGSQSRFRKTLNVPSTQLCMSYVKRRKKELLFTGGVQCIIFCWNVELIFSAEFDPQPGDPGFSASNEEGGKKKDKKEVSQDK